MKKLVKFGNAVMFFISVLWFYFTLYFQFQFFNIDFIKLNVSFSIILFILPILLVGLFYFKKQFLCFLIKIYHLIIRYFIVTMLLVVIFQLIILLTSVNLAAADTTIIYNLAVNKEFALNDNYISYYPNNYLLLLWFKFNNLFAKENLVILLSIWNMVFIDLSIYLLYKLNKYYLTNQAAELSFLLMILILGLSPQHIYTYSDSISLFVITTFIYLITLYSKYKKILYIVFSGITLAISYSLRPPLMIFVIALIFTLFIFKSNLKIKYNLFKYLKILLIFIFSFLIINTSLTYSLKHQNFVRYEPNYSRTMLYFVNLGLTYSGNIHSEVSKQVMESKGSNRNKLAFNEIKERISNYTPTSFLGHLYYKFYWIVGEGMFGWLQERVMNEHNLLDISWLSKIQNSVFSKIIRSFIYVENSHYKIYGLLMQFVWIIISLGLIFANIKFNYTNWFLLWMEITL